MEETLDLDGLTPFNRAVLHERARLAIDDPNGEYDAVQPLNEGRALYLFNRTHPEQRSAGNGVYVDLANALGIDQSRGSGRVPCPAHGDGRSKTLSWKIERDRLLVHCFAGCTFAEIRTAALG